MRCHETRPSNHHIQNESFIPRSNICSTAVNRKHFQWENTIRHVLAPYARKLKRKATIYSRRLLLILILMLSQCVNEPQAHVENEEKKNFSLSHDSSRTNSHHRINTFDYLDSRSRFISRYPRHHGFKTLLHSLDQGNHLM